MAASPVKFLLRLLVVSAVGWVVFIFSARLLAWLLSRAMGASVGFRVSGCNCLRDVAVKFKKGTVESVCIGEIKLSLHKSLVRLGCSLISRDPKLQLLISDLEVVIRTPEKRLGKSEKCSRKSVHKSHSSGIGKWMVVTNIARFLSVSVTELVVKIPKGTVEVKELILDMSKGGGSIPTLSVKLSLLHFLVDMGECRFNCDHPSSFTEGCVLPRQTSAAMIEKNAAPFYCEELSLTCDFGHGRESGVTVKNVDITCGEVTVNLNENLFVKKQAVSEPFMDAGERSQANLEPAETKTPKQKGSVFPSLKKYIFGLPEKVSFNLPKLDVRFLHRGHSLLLENHIMGIHLRSHKSQNFEDLGESTSHLDVQMDFSEIHLLREGNTSIMEILKVVVVSSMDVPMQLAVPIRAEVDVKLGGTHCNADMSRLMPWMHLHFSKKKKMVLPEENSDIVRSPATDVEAIMWTCTVSAPEMSIVLYSLSGQPLYHGFSQSSHVFANNIASMGISVHTELGELHLHMADEYQEMSKEILFGVETNLGSLVHIARVSLDWGQKEMESLEGYDPSYCNLVFSVDITGVGVYFSFHRLESLVSTSLSFQALFKRLSASREKSSQNKVARAIKPTKQGLILKINLEKCSVNFSGEVAVENTVVDDPKRVNFGSQGGEVVISVSADGTARSATIASTISGGENQLKYALSLDIFQFSLCVNKENAHTQIELKRARSFYQEYYKEGAEDIKMILLDMQNAKFVRRSGGQTAICSLFSATDIAVRWEPDVHLSLYEFMLRLKFMFHNHKVQASDSDLVVGKDPKPENEASVDPIKYSKQPKKRKSVIAVDVEMLSISAELADGVEVMVKVQSIFTENAKIGVLLEGLTLSFNEARVFKSSRMQISQIPNVPCTSDAKVQAPSVWDWVIQGLDVHICMPYRLQFRAIEDAVEDMWRGLKLIIAAKTNLLFPMKKKEMKPAKPKSPKFGSVRFSIRKVTADIEEEPIQGWLDEHYKIMKSKVCELGVRLKFLDDFFSDSNQCLGSPNLNNPSCEKKILHKGTEIDLDNLDIQKLREEIQKQAFRSYYQACNNMVPSEGLGACTTGFQAGFTPSVARTSLLSIIITDLDVALTKIENGNMGMIELVQKLDPVCMENEIPFSRLLGRNIAVRTGTLVVQLRNYSLPLLSSNSGKCEGYVVLAQQATCFQPQIQQDVFIGRWRKVTMLRSASGTTPALKMYSDLPLFFQRAEVSFGVAFEPAFADVSYAFTVALRRANLGTRNPNSMETASPNLSQNQQPPKKERSLPWWDDVRYYVHGKIGLFCTELKLNILATTDPYEKLDKLQIVAVDMDIQQSDGRVLLSSKEFKISITSLEHLMNNHSLKLPTSVSGSFLESPSFYLEVIMDWECDSGTPLNHYLHALPNEHGPREKVFDPFRSISLSLRFSLRLSRAPSSNTRDATILDGNSSGSSSTETIPIDCPTVYVGSHDLVWVFRWWNMIYNPPHKLRSFSRWPRFKIPRIPRSGNLSMDKVMTEFMLRVEATPTCVKYVSLMDDDPASGLTFKTTKVKYELCFSRGKQQYTFDCKRDTLDQVYQGVDLHMLNAYLDRNNCAYIYRDVQKTTGIAHAGSIDGTGGNNMEGCMKKHNDDGFLFSSEYFTIRRQTPKADTARLIAWQEAGRRNLETNFVRSEFENGSDSDHTRSDPSDDDGLNVVIADNCQRVFVYGLKLLWTIPNRDAVWSWTGELSKAFESPKPSPSHQCAQRKFMEEQEQVHDGLEVMPDDTGTTGTTPLHGEALGSSSPSTSVKTECPSSGGAAKQGNIDDTEEGTRHFMVNVIQPQFNLHSEEANGRFLLAAASGRVLARSFHSVLQVGYEVIEQALGTGGMHIPVTEASEPEMTWKRVELSVMLEHVQAHVAPTDVDPGAGLQWLAKIPKSSPKIMRTGALLERVFMPCSMYFRYTRHKGGTADLQVKPLKELAFNSPNITATMTSRQFQVMEDVLSNLLFARFPKPRKSSLSYSADGDEYIEEEADEVVPDGVEEVELARIKIELVERERKLLLDDIKTLSSSNEISGDVCLSPERDNDLWIITGGKSDLVQGLNKDLGNKQLSRKEASASLRLALQEAAQRLMEKEKNKSPSYAMRISLRINKVVWSMLADGKAFAEAEINNMIYDFDRDYKDIGVSHFTTRFFVVRNCLPNAKSDMLLSAWNPPPEWGKDVMLRVDAKQGAPKDGNSPLENFQVDIYPLKIHLTETMYRMMWGYFFPEEEQDSQRRQEVWKVSTTATSKRGKKSSSISEAASSASHSIREYEIPSKSGVISAPTGISGTSHSSCQGDVSQLSKLQCSKANTICGANPELRRTSSFDRTWEDNLAESVANELVLQVHSSRAASTRSGPLNPTLDHHEEISKSKQKDSKLLKSGRLSHDEKKVGKSSEGKRARARKMMEFHNIKISQVELLVTYEGSRFAVGELRLLMDTFHRVSFNGTWRRLFSRVKKHIIWSVLKSVTGMQGKKFKDKVHIPRQANGDGSPDSDLNFSDSDGGQSGKYDQNMISWLKKPSDGAGDGFVTSIKGLFSSQRKKAKAFVLRTMRGDAENELHADWSESDVEFSPFARQLTITKAKKLIRRHTKKFHTTRQKGAPSQQRESLPSSPRTSPYQSDSSGTSSPYGAFHE